ncbi:hypothetical protein [Glutamicibacter sp.]
MVRSKIAELVAELLGSREGLDHLSEYGWVQGMPVVMATPNEPLDDVMGLVSIHGRAVLVAMEDVETEDLRFVHVSMPCPFLHVVAATSSGTTTGSFFDRVKHESMVTFRVQYWKHSAVANAVPISAPRSVAKQTAYLQHLRV